MSELDIIRREAKPFPTHVLTGETAACFFCAGFLGRNAEIHVLEAGLTALCVDSDSVKLAQMRHLYPAMWTFVEADVYRLLDELQGRHFDVVIADPQLDQMSQCFALLPKFAAIAGTLVLGIGPEQKAPAYFAGATEFVERAHNQSWWAVFR